MCGTHQRVESGCNRNPLEERLWQRSRGQKTWPQRRRWKRPVRFAKLGSRKSPRPAQAETRAVVGSPGAKSSESGKRAVRGKGGQGSRELARSRSPRTEFGLGTGKICKTVRILVSSYNWLTQPLPGGAATTRRLYSSFCGGVSKDRGESVFLSPFRAAFRF